jgi:heme exporter protein C
MSELHLGRSSRRAMLAGFAVLCMLCTSLVLIFFVAPTEATMGDVQRILYLHVSVAWCGLAGCIAMAFCGGMYLLRRRLTWDFWSHASGEVGWLCTTLTLMTGSAWAHEAWGTWWTWEPRLTLSLLLWIIYAGIFLVRSIIDDPHRRGRVSAVLALVALCDVPLIFMATRWFRGVHPVSPEMEPMMRLVLLTAMLSFSALFAYLVVCRRHHLELAESAAKFEALQWRATAVDRPGHVKY